MKFTLLEKLINTPYNIVAIEDKNPISVLDTFREYYSITGKPVYIWKSGVGLYRTDVPNVKIPGTQSHEQVTQYILKSNHKYVYVLSNFGQYIDNFFVTNILRQIAKNPNINSKVMLLDAHINVPTRLKRKVLETKEMFKMKQNVAA